MRILIVEDKVELAGLLRRALRGRGPRRRRRRTRRRRPLDGGSDRL